MSMKFRVGASILALGLLASACGSGGDDDSPNAQEAPPPPQELRIMTAGEVPHFNYSLAATSEMQQIGGQVNETLVGRDSKTLQPVAKLATKWEQTGPDVWRFTLRQGVKFHDGSDFDSADVVATVDSLKAGTLGNLYVRMVSATAVDPLTVDIKTNGVRPTFITEQLWMPMMPSELAGNADRLAKETVGTGPYRLASWTKGQNLVLEANAAYWGEKAKIPRVIFTWGAEESVRVAALAAGEVDMIWPLSPDSFGGVPEVVTGGGTQSVLLRLNTFRGTSPAFADKRLREAVRYSIDTDSIIKSLLSNEAIKSINQPGSPAFYGWHDSLTGYGFDVNKAKQLVQDAGAVGKKIVFHAPVGLWLKEREITEAMAKMIEASGLDVDLQYREGAEFRKGVLWQEGQTPDITFLASNAPELSMEPQVSKYMSMSSTSGVNDPEINKMRDATFALQDVKAREDGLKEILAYNNANSFTPWFFTYKSLWGVRKGLAWTIPGDDRLFISDVSSKA